jgi:hypothetical protein
VFVGLAAGAASFPAVAIWVPAGEDIPNDVAVANVGALPSVASAGSPVFAGVFVLEGTETVRVSDMETFATGTGNPAGGFAGAGSFSRPTASTFLSKMRLDASGIGGRR